MHEYQVELESFHLLLMSVGGLMILGLLSVLAIGKKKRTLSNENEN